MINISFKTPIVNIGRIKNKSDSAIEKQYGV